MDAATDTAVPAVTAADQLLAEGTNLLEAAGVQTPRLDAEVLLAAACGIDRAALYARGREAVPPACRDRFSSMLARRGAREPMQYIVGRQEFWSLDFLVTRDVLIPRPETECLVECAIEALRGFPFPQGALHKKAGNRRAPFDTTPEKMGSTQRERQKRLTMHTQPLALSSRPLWRRIEVRPLESFCAKLSSGAGQGEEKRCAAQPLTVCDLGTGSGCIAVALACELSGAEIWALDSSRPALAVAMTNARRHLVADRIRFVESDLFAAVDGQCFDAIIANPPYVSSLELERLQPELAWEPRHALDGGPAGLDVIRRLVSAAPEFLVDGGWLIMEIGADQPETVRALAESAQFSEVSVRADYAGLPRVLLARR
ncbi:MAG: N5-glutamine methyltransferase family protein [Candidatus Binatia bacterium]